MADGADGFLGRWSQRKQAVRAGKVLDEPVATPPGKAQPAHSPPAEQDARHSHLVQPQTKPGEGPTAALAAQTAEPAQAAPPPPPSLEDVQRLTPQSDFKPFVARDIAPEVRNAAMKKLFADPQFNVMDRLDIYIDDYSKPDPLPQSMLRQMASAKFLKLFEDEEEDKARTGVRDDANTPTDHSVAQSVQPPQTGADHLTQNKSQEQGTDHDHTDLRLQPNHAAGLQEPGRGTE